MPAVVELLVIQGDAVLSVALPVVAEEVVLGQALVGQRHSSSSAALRLHVAWVLEVSAVSAVRGSALPLKLIPLLRPIACRGSPVKSPY